MCALNQLDYTSDVASDRLCEVLDIEKIDLSGTTEELLSCYKSCLDEEPPQNHFSTISQNDRVPAEGEKREGANSPDSVLAHNIDASAAQASSGGDQPAKTAGTHTDSPHGTVYSTTEIDRPPRCKSPRPPTMTATELFRGKRSKNTG